LRNFSMHVLRSFEDVTSIFLNICIIRFLSL